MTTKNIRLWLKLGIALGVFPACQVVLGFEEFSEGAAVGSQGGMAGKGGAAGNGGADAGKGGGGSGNGGTSGSGGGKSCALGSPPGKGAKMVSRMRPDGSCFWMDELEVTVGDYALFAGDASVTEQDGACAWNNASGAGGAGGEGEPPPAGPAPGFEPNPTCVATIPDPGWNDQSVPVSCVDWCDAQAYCHWAGKDLCHDSAISPDSASADESDWYAVCSGNGAYDYPYGDVRSPDACNGADSANGCDIGTSCAAVPGKTYESCLVEGAEIYDLSGNVAEWTDACVTAGQTGQCNTRGGSFNSSGTEQNCSTVGPYRRDTTDRKVGFRCCAEAP